MKLRKGQSVVHLPPVGRIEQVVACKRGAFSHYICMVSHDDMVAMRSGKGKAQIMGFPIYAAWLPKKVRGSYLTLFPRADSAYELTVRYFPPMKEI